MENVAGEIHDVLKKKEMSWNQPAIQLWHREWWRKLAGSAKSKQAIENYEEVVDGHDSMDAAQIKRLEVAGRIACVEQNASNQEARKNKKQVYAAPSQLEE